MPISSQASVSAATGPYYAQNVPLLSAAVALCCGPQAERDVFWSTPDSFCRERYLLNDPQTRVMLAPADNAAQDEAGKKIPTAQQLQDVADALVAEIRSSRPVSLNPPPPALDPALEKLLPVMVSVYGWYTSGKPAVEDWASRLTAELLNSHQAKDEVW